MLQGELNYRGSLQWEKQIHEVEFQEGNISHSSIGNGGFGIKSYVNYRHWSAPYFNKTENHVLLSDKVDKLNDDQEEAFYDIARNAIKSKESNIGFDNLKDKSLYVEKTNKKRTYHIEYVCQSDVLVKFNFRTSMNVVLKNNSLKNDNRFKFYDYKSDLTEFTSNSD